MNPPDPSASGPPGAPVPGPDQHRDDLRRRLLALDALQRRALACRLEVRPDPIPLQPTRPLRVTDPPRVAAYPASSAQARMWFLDQLVPGSTVYLVPTAVRLRGPLRTDWLEAALIAVVRRHDALRTTFAMEDDGLLQRVAGHGTACVESVSLETVPEAGRCAALATWLEEAWARPMDLESGPLFRASLARLEAGDHVLLLVLHHIISDGWSRTRLLADLAESYGRQASGQSPDLPPLALQLADVSAWQALRLETGALADMEWRWMAMLAGHRTPVDLPADHPRPDFVSFRGDVVVRDEGLPPTLRSSLESLAREEGATLFMVLLAGYALLLEQESGCSDLVVGTPMAGRTRLELEPVVGFLANTLPLRLVPSRTGTARELVRHVRDVTLHAEALQEVPLDCLIRRLGVPRDPGRHPLVAFAFLVRPFEPEPLRLPDLVTEAWDLRTQSAKFDLMLAVELSKQGGRVLAEFSTDLFEPDRVDRWLDQWTEILKQMADHPDRRLQEWTGPRPPGERTP